MSQAQLGLKHKPLSVLHRQHISEALKKRPPITEESRRFRTIKITAHNSTPEYRRAQSVRSLLWHSERRARGLKWGYIASAETRQKLSLAAQARYAREKAERESKAVA
jgi:hypothetical protein